MKQTFIIKYWYGAEKWIDAVKKRAGRPDYKEADGDFSRVGVKRAETAKKYLAAWRRKAKDRGWTTMFATLVRDDARYEIIATPDGYHEEEVVASGFMREFDSAA